MIKIFRMAKARRLRRFRRMRDDIEHAFRIEDRRHALETAIRSMKVGDRFYIGRMDNPREGRDGY